MFAPPLRAVKRTEIWWPLGRQRFDFLEDASIDDPDLATWSQVPDDTWKKGRIGTEILESINGHDCIEELMSKRQVSSVSVNRKDLIAEALIGNSFCIVRSRYPQVGRPNLNVKFPSEENRADGFTAAEIKDPHPRPEVHLFA